MLPSAVDGVHAVHLISWRKSGKNYLEGRSFRQILHTYSSQ